MTGKGRICGHNKAHFAPIYMGTGEVYTGTGPTIGTGSRFGMCNPCFDILMGKGRAESAAKHKELISAINGRN